MLVGLLTNGDVVVRALACHHGSNVWCKRWSLLWVEVIVDVLPCSEIFCQGTSVFFPFYGLCDNCRACFINYILSFSFSFSVYAMILLWLQEFRKWDQQNLRRPRFKDWLSENYRDKLSDYLIVSSNLLLTFRKKWTGTVEFQIEEITVSKHCFCYWNL